MTAPTTLQTQQAQVDLRARAAESSLVHELLAWFARLIAALPVELLFDALRSGSSYTIDRALQAVPMPQLPLRQPALKEARRMLRAIAGGSEPDLIRLGLDIRDPGFFQAVDAHGSLLVREVDQQVRDTLNATIRNFYRAGLHPYEAAPLIRETVGLTSRQATAVLRMSRTLSEQGVHPAIVERRTRVYADRLRRYRARMIARTETLRALNESRIAAIRQAAAHGLVDPETARLVWVASPDACPECAPHDGETAPIDEGFQFGGPPLHPNCRCAVTLDA